MFKRKLEWVIQQQVSSIQTFRIRSHLNEIKTLRTFQIAKYQIRSQLANSQTNRLLCLCQTVNRFNQICWINLQVFKQLQTPLSHLILCYLSQFLWTHRPTLFQGKLMETSRHLARFHQQIHWYRIRHSRDLKDKDCSPDSQMESISFSSPKETIHSSNWMGMLQQDYLIGRLISSSKTVM